VTKVERFRIDAGKRAEFLGHEPDATVAHDHRESIRSIWVRDGSKVRTSQELLDDMSLTFAADQVTWRLSAGANPGAISGIPDPQSRPRPRNPSPASSIFGQIFESLQNMR
jgi:hypothetical protein